MSQRTGLLLLALALCVGCSAPTGPIIGVWRLDGMKTDGKVVPTTVERSFIFSDDGQHIDLHGTGESDNRKKYQYTREGARIVIQLPKRDGEGYEPYAYTIAELSPEQMVLVQGHGPPPR